MLILQIEEKKENLYAKLEGKLTRKETYQVEQYLIPYIVKNKVKNFVCDCKKLKKIDIDGKYALLKTKVVLKKQKSVKEVSTKQFVCGPCSHYGGC